MSESLQWRYCDAHGTGTEYAWGCPECVREMRKEITRLTACLRYEQHRAERIGTHDPGCELWGPAHYECAVRALKELGSRAEDADVLTDDMLRYAMAALGTNSPADADLYRAFWLHAITARRSNRALAKESKR